MASGKPTATQRLDKVFGIKDTAPENDQQTYAASVPSVANADIYFEEEPTVGEYLREITPTWREAGQFVYNLFPFLSWITKYNWTWAAGDLVAGITVGAVVVPQGMAYAQLALLDVEYGLYSSFMGVLVYWFFATSKDITIGPVAVMSQVTGNVVQKVTTEHPNLAPHIVASALAVVTGAIIFILGLIRLGWIVEFIPLPAICAFMTGSAINIIAGQVSKLMGIKGIKTREAPYKVIINTLKGLPRTQLDASLGLSALFMLYGIRFLCSWGAKKQPHRQKLYFFLSTLRTVFVILLYTGISAGINVPHRSSGDFPVSILQNVPSGFRHAAVPEINSEILSSFASELPAAVIVMLIEHISISKSFGRINNYVINPSQELVAIGVSNLLGPFLGAYPATGSFSRTAIKSKAGVRTPFAGVITAAVVLLSLYALTAVFFYIPDSALAAVIIHAVGDVITPPRTVYQFWRVSPIETVIFLVGVLVTIFTTIENGIYTTVCMSIAVVIFRIVLSSGRFLGPARIRTLKTAKGKGTASPKSDSGESGEYVVSQRTGFLPLEHQDGSNPEIAVESPYPGIFIYRFAEGLKYPNASHYMNELTTYIFQQTRRTSPNLLGKLGDRPWNDNEPKHLENAAPDTRPTLKALILDFATVNHIDATVAQTLIDVRNQLDRYAAPDRVDWHFAHVESRWTKRALAAAGFGYRTPQHATTGLAEGPGHWKTIFSIADLGGSDSPARAQQAISGREEQLSRAAGAGVDDIESYAADMDIPRNPRSERLVAIQGLNRPYFHFDLQEALDAAIANADIDSPVTEGTETPDEKRESPSV